METTELLKKVRRIEIKTKGLSKHFFSGEYHSVFKGRGMSFSEVRNYQYGDDIRNIDWNVTARTGVPHIKIFEEERELSLMLVVDVSRSVYYGSSGQSKIEFITEICAVLAFSAIQNNDKVGLILFSDDIELYMPPKKGKKHILRIIREMINFEPKEVGTKLSVALQYVNNIVKKRSICFILSDFITDNYEKPLSILARRHDVIGMHITDPREKEIPNIGLVRVSDSEDGSVKIIDTSSKEFSDKYENSFNERVKHFDSTFAQYGIDTLDLSITESYIKILLKFFKQRHK